MRAFLSYRRSDAPGHAGRLHDDLVLRLGRGSVFQDVASIVPGQRFLDAIEESIGRADVVLAVIGRGWTAVDERTGRPRLDDPDDVVRRELEAALRSGRRLIPVLVDRARVPAADQVPPSLAPLLDLHAIEVRDEAWNQDVERLYEAIGVPRRRRRRSGWLAPLVATLAVVLVVTASLALWNQLADRQEPSGNSSSTSATDSAAGVPSQESEPQPSPDSVTTELVGHTGNVVWTLQRWWQVPLDGGNGTSVSLEMKVANNTDSTMTVYEDLFNLFAGQVGQAAPSLVVLGGGNNTPSAGEAIVVLVRFDSVPDSSPLVLSIGDPSDMNRMVLRA